MNTTWMCDHGHHGTSKRRWLSDAPQEEKWARMYQGKCAGTVFDGKRERPCQCDCHLEEPEYVDSFWCQNEIDRRLGK